MKFCLISANGEFQNIARNIVYELDKNNQIALCSSGTKGINLTLAMNPDVVFADIALSDISGFELIEKIKGYCPRARIIIVSYIKKEMFKELPEYNLFDYIEMPVKANKFRDYIKNLYFRTPVKYGELQENDNSEQIQTTSLFMKTLDPEERDLEEKISNIFISIGIPPHIRGYQYLREGVKIAVKNPLAINNITKVLYPQIAERYSSSPSKVERAIRHAIEVAWSRGKIENLNRFLGIKVYSGSMKPTNGEFIALIADKLLLEGA